MDSLDQWYEIQCMKVLWIFFWVLSQLFQAFPQIKKPIYSETGDITKSFTNVCSRMYSLTFLIIVFAVHGKMWWMRPLTWHQEASSGSSKGTVSNWLNRLLPHLPIPCFQLEAGYIDPIDLAEQGFPHFFIGSWSLWEFNERHRASWGKKMLRDTQAGDVGLSRGSRTRQTTVREQPGKVLVGLVIAPRAH